MGAAFASKWPQTQSCNKFEKVLWYMDSLQHNRDQAAVETVDFSGWISSEKDQSDTLRQKI